MSGRVFFDAVLAPNRSLSAAGLVLVGVLYGTVSTAAAFLFVLHGAWPVMPFVGVDAALLALALALNARASRRRERLVLTADNFVIERLSASGRLQREEINPYWLRVDYDTEPEGRDLALVASGRRWVVGSFLGADERASLAEALRAALRRARETPQAS